MVLVLIIAVFDAVGKVDNSILDSADLQLLFLRGICWPLLLNFEYISAPSLTG